MVGGGEKGGEWRSFDFGFGVWRGFGGWSGGLMGSLVMWAGILIGLSLGLQSSKKFCDNLHTQLYPSRNRLRRYLKHRD